MINSLKIKINKYIYIYIYMHSSRAVYFQQPIVSKVLLLLYKSLMRA